MVHFAVHRSPNATPPSDPVRARNACVVKCERDHVLFLVVQTERSKGAYETGSYQGIGTKCMSSTACVHVRLTSILPQRTNPDLPGVTTNEDLGHEIAESSRVRK